jgi:hypothetical protein
VEPESAGGPEVHHDVGGLEDLFADWVAVQGLDGVAGTLFPGKVLSDLCVLAAKVLGRHDHQQPVGNIP